MFIQISILKYSYLGILPYICSCYYSIIHIWCTNIFW